ncbi:hypothetical protein NWP17_00030 [Chrysosporum bergii ANA360D]|uniref:Uncharacterized protein n=1 Tax=Chrysosporum bergii ANA360D TaxID=617107 RepID=A0AA43GN21_9CYAN|nr:hypothetical protein [Chrysosporum bergii]MDH6058853.1 hypothetical protein [Chrysosporum bergii ANA360D]
MTTKTTVVLTPRAWYIRGIIASELVEEWGRRLKSPTKIANENRQRLTPMSEAIGSARR